MKIFKDRQSAGRLLTTRLRHADADFILGIPRGGVVVAAEIARILKLPLDIIVTRKIGAPNQEELALGAVDADGQIIWDKEINLDLSHLVEKEATEIKRREDVYRKGKKPLNLKNKTVILVDDGVATGLTILAAINYLKKHQAKTIILAIPVIGKDTAEKIKGAVSMMIALNIPQDFQAVGQFYYQFDPVSDEEVIQLLR